MITSHASDLLLVLVGFQARVEVRPPLKQHGVADELEPWCELECRVVKLLLKRLRCHVLRRLGLVGVHVEVDVGLDEEDVVNCTRSVSMEALRIAR